MAFQGGDNLIAEKFYFKVFDYIKEGDKVLNLGCGMQFVFENALASQKKVTITSMDILDLKHHPNVVKRYINQSVEESFEFKTKFDIVTFFELIEHIDNTDTLLDNCYQNLKKGGYLIFSFPNLASIYSRMELLLGYQPHVLEVSNEYANYGTGVFGKMNNPVGESIHHIRGITAKAAKELVAAHNFCLEKVIGYGHHNHFGWLFRLCKNLAPLNIFICKKS